MAHITSPAMPLNLLWDDFRYASTNIYRSDQTPMITRDCIGHIISWKCTLYILPCVPTYSDVNWRKVLVASEDGRVELGYFNIDTRQWVDKNDNLLDFKVLFWMDIPEPPRKPEV